MENMDLFQKTKTGDVAKSIIESIKVISNFELDEKVDAINQIRQALHDISPFNTEPVDFVKWVKNPLVHANDYNPNSVAPPEMELLRLSIDADGYTQPIEHYKNKIAVYINWWKNHGYIDGIPDESPIKIENAGKAPSWRRICKTLLKNDYWCKYMGFSPTKTSAYKKYEDLMKRRREKWGIFNYFKG